MSWPTEPPSRPTAGWYADPEQPYMWRWWDGVQWTDVRSPMDWAPTPKDPHSFSSWFEQSTAAVKEVVVRVGLAVVAAYAACFVLVGVLTFAVFSTSEAEEIGDLLEFDQSLGSSEVTVELTSAEWDRVGDLLGDLASGWLIWTLPLIVFFVAALAWTWALCALAADRHVRGETESRSVVFRAAVGRIPAVVGASIAIGVVMLVTFVVPLIPMFVAIAAGSAGGVIALTAVFGGITAIVLWCWVYGRLALTLPIAAIGGHGLGVRRSWELTEGHYWGVIARIIVASLIASIATAPLSFVSGFGGIFGAGGFLVVMLLTQTVSASASALVTVPAQVVLLDHLAEDRVQ
ncbi:MAG: DUF2510 domain-containing protein [Ilumatobacteraceae bacterium]